jgi:GNAT superfamily N-acetyltransferase
MIKYRQTQRKNLMMIDLRQMSPEELSQVNEIDVTESGHLVYQYIDGKMVATSKTWHRFSRSPEIWKTYVEQWQAFLEQGGVAIGAFDEKRLVGIAVLRYNLTENMAQLAALFVSRTYRRQGIATRLVQEIIRLARANGERELYVSATPSESAISFYTSQGFKLAGQRNKELYALEPEDMHLIQVL